MTRREKNSCAFINDSVNVEFSSDLKRERGKNHKIRCSYCYYSSYTVYVALGKFVSPSLPHFLQTKLWNILCDGERLEGNRILF